MTPEPAEPTPSSARANSAFGDLAERDRLLAACSQNLGTMLADRTRATPHKVAFLVPDRAPVGANQWHELTWTQTQQRAHVIAAGLIGLGLQPEDRVAIAMTTRIEWVLTDLGIACAGGATTTIYPNTNVDDVTHIVADSDSHIVVVENSAQLDKLRKATELDHVVRHIVILDDDRSLEDSDERVITFADLEEAGRRALHGDHDLVTRTVAAIAPDQLSTLIYTSGTTGRPKGVELTHRSWTYEGVAMQATGIVREDDLQYLWLPLSHVFGKCLLAVQLTSGFASAVDGRLDRIVTGLGEVRPTFMCGAPRIFEKVRSAVMTKAAPGSTVDKISRWAFAVGRDSRQYRLAGRRLPVGLKLKYALADRLVFSKLKKTMGGRIRFFMSGSAKLSEKVQAWFYSAGITVVEGYGATETSAIAFVNDPATPHFGTVGKVTPGMEVQIADDGELLLRGPVIARGYHGRSDATAASFDDEGWYHTGDMGVLDDDGYLSITDRKKDLIKTSGGKYVAPQKVEGAVTAASPLVSQVVALGENRKYVVALLTLDEAAVKTWAERHGHAGSTHADLLASPDLRATLDDQIAHANSTLERWETVKRFEVLQREFSVDDGGVTPNMKVRRNVVESQYADVIAGLYDEDPADL
ncbi:AMP-dependent synthetase/ligase [Aestuariimicrobium sp. T2.26MG-19.2B]|uniref:AMP-dependent synthetase/ligase n=1 Tax=Aestuariimicrobium sp. T2.26MG-19.2B TaxID=3040679 RepID=UPI002477A3F4|nr:long-chain fatty acid--CoA ligase [Aestuariimicrobium sp. T2.26MG-19.2B]CAI9407721.1 Long-chain-fatty-acid--CoA ligase FadD15 [Aestuariimicrobium sp. T2.26MG-19.2B]